MNAAVLKTVSPRGLVGSNPTLSAFETNSNPTTSRPKGPGFESVLGRLTFGRVIDSFKKLHARGSLELFFAHKLMAAPFFITVLFIGMSPAVQAEDPSEWTIRIDASKRLGSSRVKNFMFVQGGALLATGDQGSNEASQQFEIAAWKALNLTSEASPLIEEGSGLLQVVRLADRSVPKPSYLIGPLGPKRDLYLDPRNFDSSREYWLQTFGSDEGFIRVFSASAMPRTLSSNPSSDNYATYPPADYAEWRAVLEAAVRYLNQRGIHDPYIMLFAEPESDTIFNVLSPAGTPYPLSTEPVLREYVRFYAESQRAVKTADPGAKVSAMCAGVWGANLFRELRAAPEQKGLDDFIQYVAEYNETLPPGVPPAELDNICWQGYAWKDEKRMVPMAEHIQSVLQRRGFDPNVPQYLSGWSGGWASPQGPNYPLGRYAAHLVYNVIEQLNPGGMPGPIAEAHYYTWNLEDENSKSSLVRTVHDRIYYGPAASDQNCLRPAYIAFQALKALEKGDVLAVQETRPLLVRSLAVSDDAGVRVVLVNYTDELKRAHLTLERLPETAGITQAMLRHVPSDEVCGADNWFPTEDLASIFLNEPAKLTREGSGAVTASVALAPNSVVLLAIPNNPLPAQIQGQAKAAPFVALLVALIGAAWIVWARKKRNTI